MSRAKDGEPHLGRLSARLRVAHPFGTPYHPPSHLLQPGHAFLHHGAQHLPLTDLGTKVSTNTSRDCSFRETLVGKDALQKFFAKRFQTYVY